MSKRSVANPGALPQGLCDRNELTGESDPEVQFIDSAHLERNRFPAINQIRIDTPARF
jgi:hypothetical protein